MNNLKKFRLKMGLRQIDIAKLSGVGLTTLYFIEAGYDGRVKKRTKEKIAKALKLKIEELFPQK